MTIRTLFAKFSALFRRRRLDDDLSRELGSHLTLLEANYRERGLTPVDARRAARLSLGGVEQAKERHRDERSFVWLDDAWRDAAYAIRLLRRTRLTTVVTVCSLAIGIGANTAVFTVANALLFRPPGAVADPHRLVDIGIGRVDGGFNPGSYPLYVEVRGRATTLDGVYAHPMFPEMMNFTTGNATQPERAAGHFVTINYFDVLGVRPAAGRLFGHGDDERFGASPIAVLSHRYWTRRFDADPSVVGRTIRLNSTHVTIIGVAPSGFQGTGVVSADLWVPLTMIPTVRAQSDAMFRIRAGESLLGGGWLIIGGRLKPGVTLEQAAAQVESIAREDARTVRLLPSSVVPGNRTVVAVFMMVLMALVSLVLIAACANVSGILLARGAARRREMAVRLSIGASRWRLVRQLLMETIILFAAGGALGVVLARTMTALLVRGLPTLPFPVMVSLALDVRVLAFTIGLSLLAALLFGLAPALQVSKAAPASALKEDVQGPSDRSRLRRLFVAAQTACSVILIVVSGLFVRALARATVDPGFDPRQVELASISLGAAGYTDATAPRFWSQLIDRARQLPGVEHATLAKIVPGGFESLGLGLGVPGGPANDLDEFEPDGNIVDTGYFATLRIPILDGRDFSETDGADAQPVAIVGESAARHYWPGERAVGKYMVEPPDASGKPRRMRLVVGVVKDIQSSTLIDGRSQSFVYVPLRQQDGRMTGQMTVVIRTVQGQRATDELRRLVASMDANLFLDTSRTLDDSIALGLAPQRIVATMSGTLGGVGIVLAAIGVYGLMAFVVARRSRELGIRIALGAPAGNIVRMIVGQGLWLTVLGAVVGFAVAALIAEVLSAFLVGLAPLDPVTFGGAFVLLSLVGLAACYGPARRATRIDPLVAVRDE